MIALITPTGARPEQFSLCARWMQRQTYKGNVTWFIIDDCGPRSTDFVGEGFKENWTIIKIYPVPLWSVGRNTQARNLSVGIDALLANYKQEEIEAIFIIEDDDYYKPQYLERMMSRFGNYKVLGEMNTVYYNILYWTYFINRNTSHVSLFQIALKPEMIPLFKSVFNDKFIDFKFYEKLHAQEFVRRGEIGFFNEGNLAIGIKGMQGRAGIGAGHGKLLNMLPDPQLTFLKSQINIEDVQVYERYYRDHRYPQHPLLTTKRL